MIAWVLTGLGWLWSSSVWDQVWVERSEGFFPPERRTEREIAQLNGHAPLFRENDTYYWIYLTREAFLENGDWGKTRLDGLGGSRPVHWSPILPGIILTSAKIRATATSDSFLDAIHWAGHWLNPWIGWIGCGLIGWLALIGFRSSHAIFVLLLLFFHPALQWVFSPSRLDHHSLQVVVFGIQTVCICIALERTNVRRLLATGALWGFSSALGLSLSATPQLAISGGITFILFLLVLLHPRSASFLSEKRPFFLSYAAFGGGFTFVLWLIIGSVPWDNADITVLHPIHAIAIIGSGLFLAGLSTTGHSRQIHWKYCGAGLLCGIAPILWILPNPSNGHIWFQSFIPKMHVFIWDYKGAVSEGDWVNPSLWTSIFLLAVAALGFRKTSNRFLIATGILFLALGLWQQRWLNEAAVVAALALGLCAFRKSTWIVTLAIMGCGFLWLHKWVTIEQKPGIQFSADLLLRTLGRDIALNLEKEASGEPLAVAMVYQPGFGTPQDSSPFDSQGLSIPEGLMPESTV